MAERKGANVTLLDDAPQRKPQSSNAHGRVRAWIDRYNCADATLSPADTLVLARLPKGATVVGGQLDWEAMTTGVSADVTVGDSHDSDRFLRFTRLGSLSSADNRAGLITGAGNNALGATCGIFTVFDPAASDAAANRTGLGYEYTCTKDIILTVCNGTLSAGYLQLTVFYTTD